MSEVRVVDRVAGRVRRVGVALTDLEPTRNLGDFDDDANLVRYERSSRAVIRLIGCALGIAAVAAAGRLLPRTHDGLEADLSRSAGRWVVGVGEFGDAASTVIAALTMTLALVAGAAARRPRQVFTSIAAIVGAAAVVVVASRLGGSSPGHVIGEEWVLAVVAAAVAVGAASFSVIAMPVVRWANTSLAVFTAVGVLGAEVSLAARAMALLAGGAVGATAAVVFGTATRRVAGSELADAMGSMGLPVEQLIRHGGDARGSQPWLATLSTHRQVFVKVTAVDQLRSDQLFRFWRRLRLKRADDERSPASVRRAVEHEAFVGERAAAAGVNTPHVIALGRLADDRGMFAVYSTIDGTTLAEVEPTASLLRSAWSQVQILRRSQIAHRDLRAANLMVRTDEPDTVCIIDFGFSEIAASQDLLDRDLAELLVSTAALVGVDRAVEAAVSVMGANEMTEAITWVQPLAVSSASRAALSRDDFELVRERIRAAAGVSAPELPQLQRVSRKAVISVVALGVAIWAVVPQLTKGIDWTTVLHAKAGWAIAAVVASALTYVGAAVSMAGSVTDQLLFPTTFLAQIASSFTNRIAPAKVGGMALNVRYLTKQGISTARATTGVAVSTAAGAVVHILLTVVAVVWAGSTGLPGIHAPSIGIVLIVLVVLAGAAGVVTVVPPLRRWFSDSAVPSIRRSVTSFIEVMRTPRNVMMLLGGSALVTVANLAAFDVSLRAFGVSVPLATGAAVYLAGSALASAAPTPGGLGATEAALVAGLAVVDVHQNMAIPAVLLFRIATFWLPILPGWIALTVLQRRGDL